MWVSRLGNERSPPRGEIRWGCQPPAQGARPDSQVERVGTARLGCYAESGGGGWLAVGQLVLFHFVPLCFGFVPLQRSLILRLVDKGMSPTLYKSGPTTSPAEGEEMGASVVRGRRVADTWEGAGDTHRTCKGGLTCFGAAVSFSCPNSSPLGLRNCSWNISTRAHVPVTQAGIQTVAQAYSAEHPDW